MFEGAVLWYRKTKTRAEAVKHTHGKRFGVARHLWSRQAIKHTRRNLCGVDSLCRLVQRTGRKCVYVMRCERLSPHCKGGCKPWLGCGHTNASSFCFVLKRCIPDKPGASSLPARLSSKKRVEQPSVRSMGFCRRRFRVLKFSSQLNRSDAGSRNTEDALCAMQRQTKRFCKSSRTKMPKEPDGRT